MDNLPSWDAPINYQANLQQDVANIAPLATTWHGAQTGVAAQQVFNQPTQTNNTSNISKFFHFLGGVGSEVGHIAGGAASWLGHQALNMVEAPVKLGEGLGHGLVDRINLASYNQQNTQLSGQLDNLIKSYKAGQISKSDYQKSLNSLSQDFSNLSSQEKGLTNKIGFDQKASTDALINTASDLVTVLTAGFGKAVATGVNINGAKLTLEPLAARTASEWVASKAAAPLLDTTENLMNHVATNSTAFRALDKTAQWAMQHATAEVVANAGDTMTAGQIARASAVNLALKYPMMFNFTSGSAQDVYKELDQKKYGDAMRTLAFTSAMLLSGGAIGWAYKYGGKALAGISGKTFSKPAFWDELSKFYGNQDPAGFANAIRGKLYTLGSASERAQFVKDMNAVAETNIGAVGGDTKAAAYRVAKGMQGQYSFDLTKVDHQAAVNDMINYAKNFRVASQAAKDAGIGNIAIGRWDVRDKTAVSEAILQQNDTASRLKAWEGWKAQNPNMAAANNANLDKQITDIIKNHQSAGDLAEAIRNIKATTTVEGLPSAIVRTMAKDGYVPIKPAGLEAPFKEGGDKIATRFMGPVARGNEFFTKAVKPLPVLGQVGGLLTHLGLSPNASQNLTYQMFNDSLSKRLGGIFSIHGESPEQSADSLIKGLSNFAHEQKVPIKDLRQLTTKQISKALGVGAEDAKNIQRAITQAHLDVPLVVRGLGDKVVDMTYKLPTVGITRRYLRLQGALRFTFNPFFQYGRVIPKTEMLATAEGGGAIRSVFNGRWSAVKDTRQALHDSGFLDKSGNLAVVNADAEGLMGASGEFSANLRKKLLPAQEASIAGLVDAQAQRLGMDTREFMAQNPQAVRDTIQAIAEYDRKGNFINSPMARTLNIAFFPFRFDTKVAQIFTRNLAKADLATQVGVINGVMKAHDYLNSPEGQAWYAQNADAIGIFKYITPVASMAEVFNSLLPGHDHSLGNFGELGGLPFGWIPQLLDSEGLTHFNQPYMDAKTGVMIPEYIPKTDRGQAAVAIQDFIGGIFSYPGATVGLPSKTSITRNMALGLTGANKKDDFNKVTPQASPEQLSYSQAIQPPVATDPTSQVMQQVKQSAPINVPQLPTNATTPLPRKGSAYGSGSKSSGKKLKKSQYTPQLLPGQSQLGVI